MPELLDRHGVPFSVRKNLEAGWHPGRGIDIPGVGGVMPASVAEMLELSKREVALRDRGRVEGFYAPEFRNSMQTWNELLYTITVDGTAVTAAAETIMVPNFTLPAGYFNVPGRTMRYTLFGRYSTVITTPGTITQRLRYGGVAGTVLAASGAYAPDPTAASTNLTFWTQYYVVCRSIGATGTVMCVGTLFLGDYDDASIATQLANIAMEVIPVSAPATATIDTTTANALSPTWTQTAATGTMTVHVATLESMA